MNSRPHVIGKQVFEAEYNSTENGLVFRTAFTDFVKESLLPVIEEVMDELAPKNTHIRIDKLDLDLDITYPFDEYSIKENFRKKLRDELNFKIVSIRHKTSPVKEEAIMTVARTEEEIVLFFLKEGYLPWWTSESKEFTVSITQLLEEMIRKNPKQAVRILEKIKKEPLLVRRFIHHTSTAVLFELLAFATSMKQARLEAIKEYFEEEGFAEALPDFPLRVKEFLIFYFFAEKKTIVQPQELKLVFSEYLLERQQVKEYQLRTVFPERYLGLWVAQNLPAYFQLFGEYIHRIALYHTGSSKEKKRLYQLLYETFLKHYSAGREEMTLQIAKELQTYSEPAATAIRKIVTETLPIEEESEDVSQPMGYFERIARTILQYLQYGVIAWQDRAAGVKGIDRIILELHEKHPEELVKIFQKITPAFYPAVLKRIEEALDKPVAAVVLDHYFSKPEALAQWSALQYRDTILRNFFKTGTAPWAEVIGNNTAFVEEIIYAYYEQDHDYFIRVLKESIGQEEEEVIVSFVRKVEFTFSTKLTSLIRKVLEDTLLQAGKVSKPVGMPEEVDLIVYYLSYFEKNNRLPEEASFSLEELVNVFLAKFPEESSLFFAMAAYASSVILRQKFAPEISVQIDRMIASENNRQEQEARLEKKKAGAKEDETKKKQKSERKFGDKDKFVETREPVYISNAGLILIHPFIQRFFSMCNLLEKRKFKNDEAVHKAVHLLQYVVNKGEQCEEHQLVLNKILCGMRLTEPVDRNIVLTEEEKDTCESLIQGVVQNWPILKKTSNDNFRVSLLQREGRLTAEDASWRLKVEERSYDMLLDKLPWSIGMVKLPWMEKVLHVEWR